jgi:YcaO-like protein with predicted kinase domain
LETFEKARALFAAFGITRIANLTGLDILGVPVYAAYRPNSRSLSVFQGKGHTRDAAMASAVMEAIEAYHAETISLPLRLCSYNEIRLKESCADVSRLPQLKDGLFGPNKRLLWVEGTDLIDQTRKWVPFECVHTDYRDPLPDGHGCFVSSSNGLASGNTYQEALIHGLCEVIERDALTLWSLKQASRQDADKLALATIEDIRVRNILERFFDAGLDVGIWDITSDIGIPAFLCRLLPSIEPDILPLRPASGMGCHLSADIALLKAVTEAAQSRLTFISGARDDMPRKEYAKYLHQDEYLKWQATIRREGKKSHRQIRTSESETLEGDIKILLSSLRRSGITEVLAVNLTKDEFSIPVTRVLVPGLESALSSPRVMLGQRASLFLHQEGSSGE